MSKYELSPEYRQLAENAGFDLKSEISKDMFGRCVLHKGCDENSLSIPDVVMNEAITTNENLTKAMVICRHVAITENNKSVLNEGVGGVLESIKLMFKKLWESVKAFFARVWMKVSNIFTERAKIIKDNKSKIIQGAGYTNADDNETELKWATTELVNYINATKAVKTTTAVTDAISALAPSAKITALKEYMAQPISTSTGTLTPVPTSGPSFPKGLAKDGKNALSFLADTSNNRGITTNTANYSDTSAAIRDIKEDISDKVVDMLDEGDEVGLSSKINDAIDYLGKDIGKGLSDLLKTLNKAVDNGQKTVDKYKFDSGIATPGKADTDALQSAFLHVSMLNYMVQKHVSLHKAFGDIAWRFVDVSLQQFPKVQKQRNIGESATVNSLTRFGL